MNRPNKLSLLAVILALSTAGLNVQAQRRSGTTARQVGVLVQRLERDSTNFQNSLNIALIEANVDQSRSQNDINTFQPEFTNAVVQLRANLNRNRASAGDVRNVLQSALFINDFIARNRLNARVRNEWARVRADLDGLAHAYHVSWRWNPQASVPTNTNRGRLSDSQLIQLVERIDTGGDTFRSSLTEAFSKTRYDRSNNERDMNSAVRHFKSATEGLRNQLDASRPVAEQVGLVLAEAGSIDTFMQNNQLTTQVQTDWSIVRADLNTLARAYNRLATGQPVVARQTP